MIQNAPRASMIGAKSAVEMGNDPDGEPKR